MAAVDVFLSAGLLCHEHGTLAEGLELLAHRLDYAGAGELVTAICGHEWTATKQDPKPRPTPKPPPPPRPNPSDPEWWPPKAPKRWPPKG